MSKIDYQALRYGDNVLWFLNELAAYDASDIDGGEFDVYGEDRNGLEGCSTIDVTELAADAAKLIEAAEKRIAELESLTAPQLTWQSLVVPDEMTPKQASRSYCGEVRGYRDGWNDCRAAMLQGAELVSNRDELPDGWVACSERMPEKADEVLCAKEFDGPGDWRQKVGYYLAGKWTVYSASWTPTHWMPLPAAPRQEVK
ncbi:DUF551 domain-containing protein [Escherichia coli]|nr:DUF551 domain-containing protein [Escherichia coli]